MLSSPSHSPLSPSPPRSPSPSPLADPLSLSLSLPSASSSPSPLPLPIPFSMPIGSLPMNLSNFSTEPMGIFSAHHHSNSHNYHHSHSNNNNNNSASRERERGKDHNSFSSSSSSHQGDRDHYKSYLHGNGIPSSSSSSRKRTSSSSSPSPYSNSHSQFPSHSHPPSSFPPPPMMSMSTVSLPVSVSGNDLIYHPHDAPLYDHPISTTNSPSHNVNAYSNPHTHHGQGNVPMMAVVNRMENNNSRGNGNAGGDRNVYHSGSQQDVFLPVESQQEFTHNHNSNRSNIPHINHQYPASNHHLVRNNNNNNNNTHYPLNPPLSVPYVASIIQSSPSSSFPPSHSQYRGISSSHPTQQDFIHPMPKSKYSNSRSSHSQAQTHSSSLHRYGGGGSNNMLMVMNQGNNSNNQMGNLHFPSHSYSNSNTPNHHIISSPHHSSFPFSSPSPISNANVHFSSPSPFSHLSSSSSSSEGKSHSRKHSGSGSSASRNTKTNPHPLGTNASTSSRSVVSSATKSSHPSLFSASTSTSSSSLASSSSSSFHSSSSLFSLPIPTPMELFTPLSKRNLDPNQISVGIYTNAERQLRIWKFKQKKKNFIYNGDKRIRYECRKEFADKRPRIGGRFVKIKAENGEENENVRRESSEYPSTQKSKSSEWFPPVKKEEEIHIYKNDNGSERGSDNDYYDDDKSESGESSEDSDGNKKNNKRVAIRQLRKEKEEEENENENDPNILLSLDMNDIHSSAHPSLVNVQLPNDFTIIDDEEENQ